MEKIQLNDSLSCAYFNSSKFKTEKLSLYFYLPLQKENVAPLCLLAALLPDGCEKLPRPIDMARECDRLYGATISSEASKLGNMLMLHFSVINLADKYAGALISKSARQLLLDIIFSPSFDRQNFENQKRLQLDEIDALINDKRSYAKSMCNKAMFCDDDFGIILPGSKEDMQKVTLQDAKDALKYLLENAYIHISLSANEKDEWLLDEFSSKLNKYDRANAQTQGITTPLTFREDVQNITERLPVKQAKLVLGFKNKISGSDADTYKIMVMCDLFGGGTYSLLFSNVREKMSLCYYCAARANRRKGVLTVDSGVEFENIEKTKNAILEQLDTLKQGNIDEQALLSSKKALTQSLESTADSQTVTERFYADRLFDENVLSPTQLIEKINSVTKEDVSQMANNLVLDTVYTLTEE